MTLADAISSYSVENVCATHMLEHKEKQNSLDNRKEVYIVNAEQTPLWVCPWGTPCVYIIIYSTWQVARTEMLHPSSDQTWKVSLN